MTQLNGVFGSTELPQDSLACAYRIWESQWTPPKHHKKSLLLILCIQSHRWAVRKQQLNTTNESTKFVIPELTTSKLKHLWLYSVDISPKGWAFLRENKSEKCLHSTCRAAGFRGAQLCPPYNQLFSSGIARLGEETNHPKGALQHAERAPRSAAELRVCSCTSLLPFSPWWRLIPSLPGLAARSAFPLPFPLLMCSGCNYCPSCYMDFIHGQVALYNFVIIMQTTAHRLEKHLPLRWKHGTSPWRTIIYSLFKVWFFLLNYDGKYQL